MTISPQKIDVSLKAVIGKGYNRFWHCKKPYRVLMGGRGSKKSTTTALNLIVRLMEYPLANLLCIRQVERDLQQSCYAQLQWAIRRLGIEKEWKCTVSPLRMERIETGQKILFRGLDKWSSVTSMTVSNGFLCWCWVEEAFEVDEVSFQSLDESIRGIMPEGYFTQVTLSFNPWDVNCWIKRTFFDMPRDDTLAMVTTYKCNEWLSDADRDKYERLKYTDPDRYKVVALGEWGIAEGQFFKQWSTAKHVIEPFEIPKSWVRFRSMDWGSARPYACLWFAVDYDGNMYCYRELYGWGGKPDVGTGETAKQVGEHIAELETKEEGVSYGVLDNACWAVTGVSGPTIAEELNNVLYGNKLVTFGKCSKGRMEGANAVKQRLIGNEQQDGSYKPALYFFNTCIHTIRTVPMLAHDKTKPELPDTKGEDHCFIAGTMITTARGDVPIEDITLDDYVLTRQGFKKVLACGMTRKNAEVMTAYFSDGTRLTATKNHPIFIKDKGFIPFDTIPYGGIIYSIREVFQSCQENRPKQQIVSCSMESLSDVIRSQKGNRIEGITEQMDDFGNKVLATCTMKYGKPITARFQKVPTFITKMGIRSITIYRISNYCQEDSTFHITLRKESTVETDGVNWRLKRPELRQSNGTSPKRGTSGTYDMEEKLLKKREPSPRLKRYVLYAGRNFLLHKHKQKNQGFVPMHVMQNTEEITVLTTRSEYVQYVEKHSELIGSQKQRHAGRKNVASEVVLLRLQKEKQTHDVYNLAVDEVHEYFANGILVHNCYDALAYGCSSRPWAPTRPKKSKPVDEWVEPTKRSAWTY